MKHFIKVPALRISPTLPLEMRSGNSNKKIMEPFKVTQELLQKTQGIQESKEDLAMMGMNGQAQINRNILHRHKVM